MKSNNSGFMNLQNSGDPLHQSKVGQIASPNMQNNFYLSQSGPNQMNSNIMNKRKDA